MEYTFKEYKSVTFLNEINLFCEYNDLIRKKWQEKNTG